jgi:hypothetical protein
MSTSKERAMTPKMWLLRSTQKAALSAEAFLRAHRDFLTSGDLRSIAAPILARIETREIMPTPGLQLLREAILAHSIQVEADQAKAKLQAKTEAEESADELLHGKQWRAVIYNQKGEIQTRVKETGEIVDLDETFPTAAAADRWTDRRLVESASDCFGVVSSLTMMRQDGTPISNTVLRGDAIARLLKAPKQPFGKKVGTRDDKLSFGVKAHPSHAHFSHG